MDFHQRIFRCNSRLIGDGRPCYVVAEIGQNHQGCMKTAKKLIEEAKACGVDCVKFQMTHLEEKFNKAALERPYNSPHSWAATYGDHKRFLEFTREEFLSLRDFAVNVGIDFTASAMDPMSVDVLAEMKLPFVKIGSGDSNNLPLIERAASKGVPLIVSTGMSTKADVERIYSTVKKYHSNFCLLHCVSSYPTPYDECNLSVITDFLESFPDVCVGYSGHEVGTSVSLAAVVLGAKVLERHLTLDKLQKGSDHGCSLTPAEMKNLIEQIRIVESAIGRPLKEIMPSGGTFECPCMDKLRKSLTSSRDLKSGCILQASDVTIKVTEPKGIDGNRYEVTIGRTLRCDKLKDEPMFEIDFIE